MKNLTKKTNKLLKEASKQTGIPAEQFSETKVTLKLLGRFFTATAQTLEEAINKLQIGSWARGVGVLIVERGGVKKEKMISGSHIKNTFGKAGSTQRLMGIKYLKTIFEE